MSKIKQLETLLNDLLGREPNEEEEKQLRELLKTEPKNKKVILANYDKAKQVKKK